MSLKKAPFRRYNLEPDKGDIFSVRLGPQQRALLTAAQIKIQQPKPSTAIKFLAMLGAEYVLHDRLGSALIDAIYRNIANNARMGIPMAKPEIGANVNQKSGPDVTQSGTDPSPQEKGDAEE